MTRSRMKAERVDGQARMVCSNKWDQLYDKRTLKIHERSGATLT